VEKEFREIPINQVRVKDNYRKTFNETSIAELAASIKANGIVEPLIVRPLADGFSIVAGERRWRAAQIAGLVTVPCIVRELTDEEVLKLQLIENVQREGVPFMEEAYGIARLRDELSLDVAEICKIVGKSDAWVYSTLTLTRMDSEAQRLASNGFLTKGVATLIARLGDRQDQCKAANALARTQRGKMVDVRFAREYIAKHIEADGRKRLRTNKNAIQRENGNDYCSNWKKYLVNFSTVQFEYFKAIVRGRTDVPTLSEAVEQVMIEKGSSVEV
jgi:ParB family chromosome partitioning protein